MTKVPTPENVDRAMRLVRLAKLATTIPDYEGLPKKSQAVASRALSAAKVLLDRSDAEGVD